MGTIAAALTIHDEKQAEMLQAETSAWPQIEYVALAAPADVVLPSERHHLLPHPSLRSAPAVQQVLRWFEGTDASHLLWVLSSRVNLLPPGLQRLIQVAVDTGAALLYSDYFDQDSDGTTHLHPLIDYQAGSLRDDFDFGQVLILSRAALHGLADVIQAESVADEYGGWYDLRLRASERGSVVHLTEPTYTVPSETAHRSGEAHFEYVDPRNRDFQLEMEQVATAHLRRVGAWLEPPAAELTEGGTQFDLECSVIIPVRNRERTVGDAVKSALSQRADWPFNVIVVDNHSTDATPDVLRQFASSDSRLVHLIPARHDLGIGGCWNEAIYADCCGRYAVQLDSDDLYAGTDVLSRIVSELKDGGYAMVVGSYTIVDVDLQEIPPGLIDHREWTAENGHNNALRVAGLGAPRAFHVPTLRKFGFPNVSFGEDYAVALRLTRQYPLGRIYDSLYWCRRWEGNTDHSLPLQTQNRYALYKDRLRSIELAARQQQS